MLSIYELTLYNNPQVLQDMDNYQKEHWGTGITVVRGETPPVTVRGVVEDIGEIDSLMRERPHSHRRVK